MDSKQVKPGDPVRYYRGHNYATTWVDAVFVRPINKRAKIRTLDGVERNVDWESLEKPNASKPVTGSFISEMLLAKPC